MEQITYLLLLLLILELKYMLTNINWKRVWSRSFDHLMGDTDHDEPTVPILSQREANISLIIRSSWILLHVITCVIVIASNIHHW